MRVWKKALSKSVVNELKRLQNGNKHQQQRYNNTLEAITRTLVDPVRNIKHDLGDYHAADVLAQYRLFYEIIDKHNVVHFVWLNDEKYIHDNSKNPDPCYQRFKDLANGGQIEDYEPPLIKEGFTIRGNWRKEKHIYATYVTEEGSAHSNMHMEKTNSNSYRIVGINAEVEGEDLEKRLLAEIAKSAKRAEIFLFYELDLHGDLVRVGLMKKILKECGFKVDCSDDEIELWIK